MNSASPGSRLIAQKTILLIKNTLVRYICFVIHYILMSCMNLFVVSGCIRPLVPVSVVFASFVRGSIEAPFEYAKVMGQTEQKWQLNTVFRGFHWQLARTTLLLLPIFTTFDYLRRKTDILKTLSGNFFVTMGVVGTLR